MVRMQVRIPQSWYHALVLMGHAAHRTPQQQLAVLVERWWSQDPDMKPWIEETDQTQPWLREESK
jgi:hypothetical protein